MLLFLALLLSETDFMSTGILNFRSFSQLNKTVYTKCVYGDIDNDERESSYTKIEPSLAKN